MTDPLLCIELILPAEHAGLEDLVEGAIWDVGAAGVERQDDTTFSDLIEEPRPRPPGSIRWRVYMAVPDDIEAAVAPFREAVPPETVVEHWVLEDLSFMSTWRDFFRPTLVSPRFMVHPPWEVPTPEGDVHLIEIEPGMAFGTGTHETTRLCLAAIDRHITANSPSFLDVGCGSGVLSIAAAKLGAGPVIGFDHDQIAVDAAIENARINNIDAAFDAKPSAHRRGTFDLVVANILPHILIDIVDDVVAHLADDGVLVLSGIMTEQKTRVCDAYTATGLAIIREDQQGDWWSVEFRTP